MEGTTLIEAEILGVTEREATRKSDGQMFKMYDIQVGDGSIYTTTFVDKANDAFALIGKVAKLSVKIQQNGQWINRYLQNVLGEVTIPSNARPEQPSGFAGANAGAGAGAGAGADTSVTSHTGGGLTGRTAAEIARPALPAEPQIPTVIESANDYEADRQKAIHRQTATKVAAMLFVAGDSQVDFWDNVDTLIRYFDTGMKPLSVEMQQEAR